MPPQELRELFGAKSLNQLDLYVSILDKWRKITNLIADDSFSHIWTQHILSAYYLQQQAKTAKVWLDIGSGAGLPAVVIASLFDSIPQSQVHCVEIDRRKAAFLREVVSQLELNLKVHNTSIDELDPSDFGEVDVITAQAFSSIERILRFADAFLARGSIAILPRGRSGLTEVARQDHGRYTLTVTPNPASRDGVFVRAELRAPQS